MKKQRYHENLKRRLRCRALKYGRLLGLSEQAVLKISDIKG